MNPSGVGALQPNSELCNSAVSGDHDRLGIAPMSANLYWRLYQIQPKQVELRVVDGDHEWMTFRDALPAALQYIEKECTKPD